MLSMNCGLDNFKNFKPTFKSSKNYFKYSNMYFGNSLHSSFKLQTYKTQIFFVNKLKNKTVKE